MFSAQYTVVLKSLMDDTKASERLNKALETYPMYESKSNNKDVLSIIPTREQLNTKLLNYYKYHEIGFETPGRFFDELEIAMNEIMPYYNQMLHTVEIMNDLENPFDNVDVTETYDEERTDTSTGTTSSETSDTSTGTTSSELTDTSTGTTSSETSSDTISSVDVSSETNSNVTHTQDHLKKHSDTPQGSVSDIDSYLTDATKETANDSDTSSETGTSSTAGSTISTVISETETSATSNGTSSSESSATSNGTSETETSATSNGTVRHTLTRKGNQGVNTYAHDIIEFRTSILNVEQMIISDKRIRELFMLIY